MTQSGESRADQSEGCSPERGHSPPPPPLRPHRATSDRSDSQRNSAAVPQPSLALPPPAWLAPPERPRRRWTENHRVDFIIAELHLAVSVGSPLCQRHRPGLVFHFGTPWHGGARPVRTPRVSLEYWVRPDSRPQRLCVGAVTRGTPPG